MASQAPGAPVGGGESPGGTETGPTPAARHASQALLTLAIDVLTELVQTVEAKHRRSIHQRLVDALKAVDYVRPWHDVSDPEVQDPEPRAQAYAGGDA